MVHRDALPRQQSVVEEGEFSDEAPLWFEENNVARTQEFALLWRSSNESNWREIVRQQFNFSPPNTTSQREEFNVSLNDVYQHRVEDRARDQWEGKGFAKGAFYRPSRK